MNSVHDMGGMHGLGPIRYEKNEPVFHARWEGRVLAMRREMAVWVKSNLDAFRHRQERVPAADYLRMSYYERWFTALVEELAENGLVTRAEVASGKRAPRSPKAKRPVVPSAVPQAPARGFARRDVPVAPLFQAGQSVRTRNLNPLGHTRLPRYARGKRGMIHRDHGVFVFPDTNAHGLGEKPQHVYSVRFGARELWGEQAAPRDAVYLDLWDDYLEPA